MTFMICGWRWKGVGHTLNPSMTSWCALAINSISLLWLNCCSSAIIRTLLHDIAYLDYISSEQEPCASRWHSPTLNIWYQRYSLAESSGGQGKAALAGPRWRSDDLPSGSDHSKSHIGPSCGTSCFLSITLIYQSAPYSPLVSYARTARRTWSSLATWGLNPPWTQKTLPSTIAPSAR